MTLPYELSLLMRQATATLAAIEKLAKRTNQNGS